MIDEARPSDQGEYLLGDEGGLRIRQGGQRGEKAGSSNTPTPLKKTLGLGVYPDVRLRPGVGRGLHTQLSHLLEGRLDGRQLESANLSA